MRRLPSRLLVALIAALALVSLRPAMAADDPLTNRQWALTQIHAPSAWAVSTGKDVKIGIVDSGVNRTHEDLIGKVIASATCVGTGGDVTKCTTGSGAGDDINGHGTHVAGIAAGLTSNGVGIASVAPDAKIIEARVFAPTSGEPTADLNDVQAGIKWVVSQGAQIVNLSLGVEKQGGLCLFCGGTSNPLAPAIEDAWNHGALPIVAAGNNSGPGYANLDAIIVGATGPDDNVESYSVPLGNAKYGIVAPGGDIVSTTDPRCTGPSSTDCPMVLSTYSGPDCKDTNGQPDPDHCYGYLAGTSFAAPHVSGAAALLFAKGLTRQEVVDTLLATADPLDCGTNCAGRLNAQRAVGAVANDDTNNGTGGNNNGGGGNGHTATTRKSTGTSAKGGATTTTPTTSPFAFNNERPSDSTSSLRPPRAAIVLNTQPRSDGGVPVGVGLAGIVSLAFAALAMSYNLRKMVPPTLP